MDGGDIVLEDPSFDNVGDSEVRNSASMLLG